MNSPWWHYGQHLGNGWSATDHDHAWTAIGQSDALLSDGTPAYVKGKRAYVMLYAGRGGYRAVVRTVGDTIERHVVDTPMSSKAMKEAKAWRDKHFSQAPIEAPGGPSGD